MGEFKRVFLDPRRLALWLLTAVLCAGLFVLSLLDRVAPEEVGRLASANAYVDRLVEQWRGKDYDEITELAQNEWDRIENIYLWYFDAWDEPLFETEEDALASIKDLPALARAVRDRDNDGVFSTYVKYLDAVQTLQGEIEYLSGYGAYLAGVQAQAESQAQTSLFGRPGSFAQRNLSKTAEDFRGLLGVETAFGNSQGIERWLNFELADYFHLLAIIVTVLAFLEERKKGLWPVLRTTRGGRGRLGLVRVGSLFAASAGATVLYTVAPFVLSMTIHGGWGDLTRPLQSVESFSFCTLRISVAQWLGLFFAVKVLAGVFIGLFLWFVLGAVTNPQFTVSVLGVTLAAEYALYAFLPVQSILNGLKYLNIFAYVRTATLYTEYLNIDLFGFPVGNRRLALWAMAAAGALLTAVVLLDQARRRPEGNRDLLSRLAGPVDRALDRARSRLTVGGWEGYKTLIYLYGVFMLALVVLVSGKLSYLYASSEPVDPWYESYISDMEGPIEDSTDEYLAFARESAGESENAEELLPALDRVEARVEQLRARAREGRYAPWVADSFPYDICYGPQSVNTQRLNAAVAILLTVLLAAPLWAFERQSGVMPMLRSTPYGRGRLLRRKVICAALLAAFVWACVYLREVRYFITEYPRPATLSAPVQNIDELAAFPANVTLGRYLALLYAVRLVMLVGTAEAALAVGLFCANVRMAYVAGTAALALPALLTALGAEPFKWISPVVPVASAELLWGLGSGRLTYLLPWAAWLAASLAGTILPAKKWLGQARKRHIILSPPAERGHKKTAA